MINNSIRKPDKDRFRQDLGDMEKTYNEMIRISGWFV